jgi:hypothetical protein
MLGLVIWKYNMAVISVGKDHETAVERAETFERQSPDSGGYFAVGINGQEARDIARVLEKTKSGPFSSMGLVIEKKTMTVVDVEEDVTTAAKQAKLVESLRPYQGEYLAASMLDCLARTVVRAQENIDIQAGIAANLAASEMED